MLFMLRSLSTLTALLLCADCCDLLPVALPALNLGMRLAGSFKLLLLVLALGLEKPGNCACEASDLGWDTQSSESESSQARAMAGEYIYGRDE